MENKELQSILTDLDNKVISKHQAYDLILILFNVSNSLSKQNACTCWRCMGLEKDPYEDDSNDW